MDTFAVLALATDPPTSDLLDRKPSSHRGEALLNYGDDQLQTLFFNTFVFLQIFNKLNIFKGILANQFFMFIFVLMVSGQALIVNYGELAFQMISLNGEQ
ncbi:9013_t:CDS:2 [Paraglomus brasilianum]|uniref:9013_t:CDS:1 n=1 Tax=Paraglomus brasilianum TaxID=144538 RepID=A0A9N9FKN8_9GLOM|nr:9013_t:CDS:2 [Paraglomus brasilianum]